ncbi:uncharacterized protein PgNI_06825 [Pyricularia grisea]|uniref:Uncharacterized protein n=1 Tax=Pyricularia grisea TaxID=148305 RepID=A0A6P8B182_PYRGI|nr:uncharacterized protein PgNI_06825 [Pyricularia grisea]TLD08478.1 hypothetical protein PgNI_06825 [Pyricularia grisea]
MFVVTALACINTVNIPTKYHPTSYRYAMSAYGTIGTYEDDIELEQMAPDERERVVLRMPLEQQEFSVPVIVVMFIATFAIIFWTIWFLASPPNKYHHGGGGSDGDSGWF